MPTFKGADVAGRAMDQSDRDKEEYDFASFTSDEEDVVAPPVPKKVTLEEAPEEQQAGASSPGPETTPSQSPAARPQGRPASLASALSPLHITQAELDSYVLESGPTTPVSIAASFSSQNRQSAQREDAFDVVDDLVNVFNDVRQTVQTDILPFFAQLSRSLNMHNLDQVAYHSAERARHVFAEQRELVRQRLHEAEERARAHARQVTQEAEALSRRTLQELLQPRVLESAAATEPQVQRGQTGSLQARDIQPSSESSSGLAEQTRLDALDACRITGIKLPADGQLDVTVESDTGKSFDLPLAQMWKHAPERVLEFEKQLNTEVQRLGTLDDQVTQQKQAEQTVAGSKCEVTPKQPSGLASAEISPEEARLAHREASQSIAPPSSAKPKISPSPDPETLGSASQSSKSSDLNALPSKFNGTSVKSNEGRSMTQPYSGWVYTSTGHAWLSPWEPLLKSNSTKQERIVRGCAEKLIKEQVIPWKESDRALALAESAGGDYVEALLQMTT